MQRILVWLSWWVDSAVSAYLLKKQWYDVTAWFMINYLDEQNPNCPTREDIEVAREVAKFLEIPFFTFDYREDYEEKVLNYMYEWYRKWITPNPDIMCNSEVKFKLFLEEAIALWFDKVATWHYARIINSVSIPLFSKEGLGEVWSLRYSLLKWIDKNKDQSYFLAWLNSFQLSKALFPIGHLEKSEVRKIALEANLPNAKRKDSQWICFVWKVNLIEFLEKKIKPVSGKVFDTKGNYLWEHKWVFYYTIGQRKWLDIWGQKEAIFVIKKDLEKNEIIVWTASDLELYSNKLTIKNINFLNWEIENYLLWNNVLEAKAKIRYRQEDQKCSVKLLPTSFDWEMAFSVSFLNNQRAISSWQICAIYLKDELVLSWVIQ